MENETIKQNNLVTYLALTISCSCLKLFQYDKKIMYVFTPSGILKDWSISLPATCGYNFHAFMNSWIHEFMTHQGACKSGDAKFR